MSRVRELILRSLAAGPRTMWDLVAEQNTQHRRFTAELRALRDQGLLRSDEAGMISLTPLGWAEAGQRSLADWHDRTCPTCAGRGVVAGEDLLPLRGAFERLSAGRPSITTEFDQGVVPSEVALARVALLEQRGDLYGKDILILGDDDLMSLAFMLRGLPRRIVVLEIDRRITAYLRSAVAGQGWHAVEVIDYDVRHSLPAALRGQFDVFFTDPVETAQGIALFLSRCAEALRGDGGVGYFGLTHIESGWAKWLEIERAALQMNLVIAEVLKDFSQYLFRGESVLRGQMKIVQEAPVALPPPDRLWYSSTLFRLQAVGALRPAIVGPAPWGRELYADEDTI